VFVVTGSVISPVTLRAVNQRHTGPVVARRTLPVAVVPTRRSDTIVYGMATLDSRGRVADHHILTSLNWPSGTRLDIHEVQGVLVISATPTGVFTINKQGHLHLPAAVRHRCGLSTGDRILLVAYREIDTLVIHPPASLDALFAAAHSDLLSGDVR
jgi:hypothetical protein